MRLLLDTHTFIWFTFNAPELPPATRKLLENGANELFFSDVSVWEMSIKVSIGKLHFSTNVTDLVSQQMKKDDLQRLPIEYPHLSLIEILPLHHKDPFDRLLIAQAQVENLSIISIDAAFDRYNITRLWLP